MKWSEMMDLARAGYKPNEIADMHKLQKEADAEMEVETEVETVVETEVETVVETKAETVVEAEDQTELKIRIDELTKQLEAAQKANVMKDISSLKQSNEDILAAAVRRFM